MNRTPEYFRETVGLRRYEKWLREETEYYSRNFSGEDNLAGFSVGLFNEPFVSQRGSLLCYDFITTSYELAQYTPPCLKYWQAWLKNKYSNLKGINKRYNTSFKSLSAIPMPRNEHDQRFGKTRTAYCDLISSVNDWVVAQYNGCHAVWHKHAKRPVPFILQFSGYVPEKFSKGRPCFAMLDIYSWMQTADALGFSIYTNQKYYDWGHASDTAMAHNLYLAVMQNKHVFVMEGGSEDDGAVLIPAELNFIADTSRLLKPDCCIYEFFKAPFYAHFRHNEGYVINSSGVVDKSALESVKAALTRSQHAELLANEVYVYDAPASLSLDNDDLNIQKYLQVTALDKTLLFVPEASLALLPRGASLLIIQQNCDEDVLKLLTAKGINVVPAREWIKMISTKPGTPANVLTGSTALGLRKSDNGLHQ